MHRRQKQLSQHAMDSGNFEATFADPARLDYGYTGLCATHAWVPVVRALAPYPLDAWLITMHELIRYPERTSSSIRRAEIWAERNGEAGHGGLACTYRCIRRLLPRRTHVDAAMLEECAVYADESSALVVYTALRNSHHDDERDESLLDRKRSASDYATEDIPYYHPAVRCVGFHYSSQEVRIDYVPFESSDLSRDGRLGRTALSLLRLIHKHSCGNAQAYEKRVHHDVIVPRDDYQDFYLALRTRHAGRIIASWQEATDPMKHVFEDIAIAAWLILLWRSSYNGAPPGGFVDLGCGNGLLVHLLHTEVRGYLQGFQGFGFDARARKSWSTYADTDLRELEVDPQELVKKPNLIPSGAFLIGNHADELTPWVPSLAASAGASGFVNIPCCAWKKEGTRFSSTSIDRGLRARLDELAGSAIAKPLDRVPSPHDPKPATHAALASRTLWHLHRCTTGGDDAGASKHFAYHAYIAHLHLESGWPLETEVLRIPSTKNWAFVARVSTS